MYSETKILELREVKVSSEPIQGSRVGCHQKYTYFCNWLTTQKTNLLHQLKNTTDPNMHRLRRRWEPLQNNASLSNNTCTPPTPSIRTFCTARTILSFKMKIRKKQKTFALRKKQTNKLNFCFIYRSQTTAQRCIAVNRNEKCEEK